MSTAFSKALLIMEKLLAGKTPKEIAYELDISYAAVTDVKNKFPLFLGLPRGYKKED